jgi:transposase
MTRSRGKPLTPEEKEQIITLKGYFDRNKASFGLNETSIQLTSEALGVGKATVARILAAYNKNPKNIEQNPLPKGRPNRAINDSQQERVRTYIRAANSQGTYITLETIRDFLQTELPEEGSFHIATLARTLDRWGFEFGKGTRTQHLKEKASIIAARRRYLRIIRNNRINNSYEKTKRPEVYLDESYVNKNHSNDFVWYSQEDGPWIQKPTGNGERLIIMNAITQSGWVNNAKVVFKSTRKTGDYHGEMNFDLFKKWFVEQLIENIPKGSIIIMDNAPYHNVLSETSAPIPSSSRKDILHWLEKNRISCRDDALKPELVEMLVKLAPEATYAIDEVAKQHGHEVLRTPPYHPELQPIELCWGVVKNKVARNCDFTMNNLMLQLEAAFTKVTSKICQKMIEKVKKIEDEFWAEDEKLDLE